MIKILLILFASYNYFIIIWNLWNLNAQKKFNIKIVNRRRSMIKLKKRI